MINDALTLTGMVLSAAPAGETDRRIVLLTKERGKITAFARGARKPNSPLVAATRAFAFGRVTLFEGRNSYTVSAMEISNYFEDITTDLENSCYAGYFSELAGYYAREGAEAGDMLKLLYASLVALQKGTIPKRLIRSVYELKLMQCNGEYSETPLSETDETTAYAWSFVLASRIEKLFSFTLKEEYIGEFARAVAELMEYYIDRDFKSLEILSALTEGLA